jgi:hypothetical protein
MVKMPGSLNDTLENALYLNQCNRLTQKRPDASKADMTRSEINNESF